MIVIFTSLVKTSSALSYSSRLSSWQLTGSPFSTNLTWYKVIFNMLDLSTTSKC